MNRDKGVNRKDRKKVNRQPTRKDIPSGVRPDDGNLGETLGREGGGE